MFDVQRVSHSALGKHITHPPHQNLVGSHICVRTYMSTTEENMESVLFKWNTTTKVENERKDEGIRSDLSNISIHTYSYREIRPKLISCLTSYGMRCRRTI